MSAPAVAVATISYRELIFLTAVTLTTLCNIGARVATPKADRMVLTLMGFGWAIVSLVAAVLGG